MKGIARTPVFLRVAIGLLVLSGIGCSTSVQPTAPTPSPNASSAPDGSTLKATPPVPQSPVGDQQVPARTPITLVAAPADGIFVAATFQYRFELRDAEGELVQESGLMGDTSWQVTADLEADSRYLWRVRAEIGNAAGPWSETVSFMSPPRSPCAHLDDPLAIIGCWIAIVFDDEPGPGEHWELLSNVAREFNRAGVPGGPFGILVKQSGNNCVGYSCDIICAGQGNDQEQYDVLIDDRIPVWGGPIEQIRADVCEIQWPD